ncbi:MAG: hypothetical protein RLZZ165_1514 [Bacteroidota bacterium]|jgi:O-antigen ligase
MDRAGRDTAIFPDTNFLSAAMALLLFPLVAQVPKWVLGWRSLLTVLLLILFVAGVAVFRSRAAWVSLAKMCLLMPILFFRRSSWRMGLAGGDVGGDLPILRPPGDDPLHQAEHRRAAFSTPFGR